VLLVVAAGGWGVWTYLMPHTVTLPNVVGDDLTAAERRLNSLGLSVRTTDGRYSKEVAEGRVLRMQPSTGVEVDDRARVTLVPSLGPPPVDVPDVIGGTVEEARTLLRAADLSLGKVRQRYSDRFDVGHIVKRTGDAQVPWGSKVDVWVSRGPKPLPIPDVVGSGADEARTALEPWVVTWEQRFSDAVPRDLVIAQHPRPGTHVQPGEGITVVVSLGPETFAMPNVVDVPKDTAVARLKALGLQVAVFAVPNSTGGTVVSQEPSQGVTVRYGQKVTIYVA
jgi:serine/threonine-protein kinase